VTATTPDDGLEIRHVRTHDEFVACVELQAATWGDGFRERVPATILKISARLGGVTAGAFTADGTLVGFVFGMTGIEHGALVHWSDMLAVREGMQNHGLGRRLKEFQRDAVRELGVTRMYWTYDPLVARNAHFNLNRLGARVAEYVPDMYGADTGSAMHSGFGTDRFIVVWPMAPADDASPGSASGDGTGPSTSRDAPVLNTGADGGRELDAARIAAHAPVVRVAIPTDIFRVQADSTEQAARWRAATRRAFQWALANGDTLDRFEPGDGDGRGFYRLTRG
jgi:predicted GNAT superfamily acetyltransferase